MYPSIQETFQCICTQTRACIYSGVWNDRMWERLSERETVHELYKEALQTAVQVRAFLSYSNLSYLDSALLHCIV